MTNFPNCKMIGNIYRDISDKRRIKTFITDRDFSFLLYFEDIVTSTEIVSVRINYTMHNVYRSQNQNVFGTHTCRDFRNLSSPTLIRLSNSISTKPSG